MGFSKRRDWTGNEEALGVSKQWIGFRGGPGWEDSWGMPSSGRKTPLELDLRFEEKKKKPKSCWPTGGKSCGATEKRDQQEAHRKLSW